MSDDFKDFSTTPTLTFDVTPEPEELPAVDTDTDLTAVNEDPAFDESRLSPEELKMVEDFSAKIDLHNSQAILQYGVGTQKKMADFSEKALENVKTKDMGEIGDMITDLVTELKSFDVEEEEKGLGDK